MDFALNEFGCEKVCTRVGFHDPWKVMLATTNCKQLLAILTTIQWLKVIKYINGVVPPEKQGRLSGGIQIVGAVAAALGLGLGYSLWLGLKTSAERGTRRTKRDFSAAAPFFAAAVALVLASLSLYSAVSRERVEREGSKKKEYDSVADEWVHQRVTESESDDESVEALTVRTPLQ